MGRAKKTIKNSNSYECLPQLLEKIWGKFSEHHSFGKTLNESELFDSFLARLVGRGFGETCLARNVKSGEPIIRQKKKIIM